MKLSKGAGLDKNGLNGWNTDAQCFVLAHVSKRRPACQADRARGLNDDVAG